MGPVERKESTQRPAPPFTTSTLQQAASGRLRLTPQRAMRIAQRLYEGVALGGGEREGLITYMRTDSLTLSEKALAEAERPDHARIRTGVHRRARAATAPRPRAPRRPTRPSGPPTSAARPELMAAYLDGEDLAVYRLIWNRAVASQMTDAKLDKTAVDFAVTTEAHALTFRSNGSIVTFPGLPAGVRRPRPRRAAAGAGRGHAIGGTGGESAPGRRSRSRNVEPLRHETRRRRATPRPR